MDWQIIIVFSILSIVVSSALYMIWKRLSGTGNPCNGCDGCNLKGGSHHHSKKVKRKGKCHLSERKDIKYLRE